MPEDLVGQVAGHAREYVPDYVTDYPYLFAVLVIGFVITLALRAVPFAILEPLRKSGFVRAMADWMPPGILGILAVMTFMSASSGGHLWQASAASAVTVATHLFGGRHTLVSVGAGTLTYVVLVNLV